MSIDLLQSKMKKQGNALILDLAVSPLLLPPGIIAESSDEFEACQNFAFRLLTELKGRVAAVRFRVLHYALLGEYGMKLLSLLLRKAAALGYYTLLDAAGTTSAEAAKAYAQAIWGEGSVLPCDAILISGYCGTEVVKPFLPYCEKEKKDLFVSVRLPNKTASEIQDLLAGSRVVHMAAADYANRLSGSTMGRLGYSSLCIAGSATLGDSLKRLRAQYPKLFLLVDGLDEAGANARNASFAFDDLGRGAICCVGRSVTGAWMQEEYAGVDFAAAAVDAAMKTQKRINRYVTVM